MRSDQKSTKRIFVVVAVAFFILVAALSTSAQIKKQVLDRIEGNYQTLNSLTADVVMVKDNDQIGSKDTYRGSTKFLPATVKPKRVRYIRLDWVKPASESMVLIGDAYKIYRENTKTLLQGTQSSVSNNSTAGNALM